MTLVRNVTDIDDKILRKAQESGEPWFVLSYRNERATSAALDTLGVLPATYEPRATGHITEMITLMDTLVEKGHAYAASDGSGDVYFDVRSWPAYGSLSHQALDDMEPAEDADPRAKRDPRDFALWKGHKPDEPESASWPTPYGAGRPGWHLECSAMARRYLGDAFDIHGGGIDLRFPHHENEQAQSRAAGLGFANFWLHNAWVTVKDEKMGKSLGQRPGGLGRDQGGPSAGRALLPDRGALPLDHRVPRRVASRGRGHRRADRGLPAAGRAGSPAARCGRHHPKGVRRGDGRRPQRVRGARRRPRDGPSRQRRARRPRPRPGARAGRVGRCHDRGSRCQPASPTSWHGGSTPGQADAMVALDALVSAQLAQREKARAARDFHTADAIRGPADRGRHRDRGHHVRPQVEPGPP